jgi:hypothetical protein
MTEDESEPCVYGVIVDMVVTINFRKGGNLSKGHEAGRRRIMATLGSLVVHVTSDAR